MSDEYNLTFEDGTVSRSTERFEIEHDGQKAWFEKKDLTFDEMYQIADEALKIEDGNIDIEFYELNRHIRRKQIVDSSIENHESFLAGVKPELGKKISSHLTDPQAIINVINKQEGN